jgi:23S rRNA pseudouridine1911/1915/1917 synthase
VSEKKYHIIYEDEWLLGIDKPSGSLVIPTPKKETNTLTDILNKDLDGRGVVVNAYPCHRLDRETSGVIIYAKGKRSQQLMMDEFRKRAVKKTYVAFVQGIVKKNAGVIADPIFNRNKKRREDAVTKYKVLARKGGFTVVGVEPLTGRTNQIRIHFVGIGHPLLGESVYAFRKDFKLRFKRVALHARAIEFMHPVTRAMLKIEAPLPKDMESLWSVKNS